jgi:hypothetical protein
MPGEVLDEFGKLIIEWVRDRAINVCDNRLDRCSQTAITARWAELIAEGSAEEAIRAIIPDCVDTVISYLLIAIDQEMIKISFARDNGEIAELPEDSVGEVAGWYEGAEDGWVQRYSTQRFHDYFANLTLRDIPAEGADE